MTPDNYLSECESDAINNPRFDVGMMVDILDSNKNIIGMARVLKLRWDYKALQYLVEVENMTTGRINNYWDHRLSRIVFDREALRIWLKKRVYSS